MDSVRSVAGILFSEDRQKLLLIERRDIPVWVLPGGGVSQGETPEEAVVREFEEETGLKVSIKRRIALYNKAFFFTKKTLFYECSFEGGDLLQDSSEVKGVSFFAIDNLPKQLPPPYPELIEDAIKNLPPMERALTSITVKLLLKAIFFHPILLIRFLLTRLGLPINT